MLHNHPILYLFVLMLVVPFIVSCTTPPPPPPPIDTSAEDRLAINTASAQGVDAFKMGDVAAFAAIYTQGAKLLQPNSPMIVGRENIQENFQGFFEHGSRDIQLSVIELSLNGDMAHKVGTYTLSIQPEEGESMVDNGKYVEIWKRVNGTWMMDVDIWNTSVSFPVAEEEMETEEEE